MVSQEKGPREVLLICTHNRFSCRNKNITFRFKKCLTWIYALNIFIFGKPSHKHLNWSTKLKQVNICNTEHYILQNWSKLTSATLNIIYFSEISAQFIRPDEKISGKDGFPFQQYRTIFKPALLDTCTVQTSWFSDNLKTTRGMHKADKLLWPTSRNFLPTSSILLTWRLQEKTPPTPNSLSTCHCYPRVSIH